MAERKLDCGPNSLFGKASLLLLAIKYKMDYTYTDVIREEGRTKGIGCAKKVLNQQDWRL